MLDVVSSFFISALTLYLSLTQGLADILVHQFPSLGPNLIEYAETTEDITTSLRTLPSEFQNYEYGGAIPNILKENATYQQASTIAGSEITSPDTTSNIFDALVNVFCTYTTEESRRTTTGTGVLIDQRGVILTNAHVAQFLLLETVSGKGQTECEIRSGNPATPRYKAELLYISPQWVQKYASLIGEMKPRGTGERDYALLYVFAGAHNKALPRDLPFLSIDTTPLSKREESMKVEVGGYPAEGVSNGVLVPKIATSKITELFTFGSDMADIMSVGGSEIGVGGSSGGPVLNSNKEVIGLIVTKGNDAEDGTGSLRALTLSYINRTMEEETGFTISENIQGDLAYRARLFKETLVPFLAKWLQSELE